MTRPSPTGDAPAELATIEWRAARCGCSTSARCPGEVRFLDCTTVDDLIAAIQSLAVRGAPALGAAGAYGVALAAHTLRTPRAGARRGARGSRGRARPR